MKLKEKLYWDLYHPLMMLCVKLFYYLPVKNNKIIFFHDAGNGYGDSPKYMAEEILRRNLPYDIVWAVKDKNIIVPSSIRKTLITRIQSVYELATSKVIVTTLKGKYNLKKKKSQFFIYVPHGQIGAKYVEAQAGKTLGTEYPKNSAWHSSVSDLFLSSSKLFTAEVRNYYWYPEGEIAEIGLPRNDIFFNYKKEDVRRIKEGLKISMDTHVALYAPTFRDNGDDTAYSIDINRVLSALGNRFGGKWIFLVRLHRNFVWFKKPSFEFSDHIIDVTSYPDIQELLLISNVLFSDYSSTVFDFNLMHRPIFLFTKDIEEYKRVRGIKDWFFKVPFPFCHNNDELCGAILKYDDEKYKQECKTFDELYGSLENGKATESIINMIEQIIQK